MEVNIKYDDYNVKMKEAKLDFVGDGGESKEEKDLLIYLAPKKEVVEGEEDCDNPVVEGEVDTIKTICNKKEEMELIIKASENDIEEIVYNLDTKAVQDLIRVLKGFERQL